MYAIGNDHTAVALKQIIKAHLEAKGIEVKDFRNGFYDSKQLCGKSRRSCKCSGIGGM